MADGMAVIEINGVKMEVDLRTARTVESYKIGDNVKVLKKNYGDSYSSYPGVIVGFDDFKQLPTIVICYITPGHNAGVEFVFYNAASRDVEICHMAEHDKLVSESDAVAWLDRDIAAKEAALLDVRQKREYFLRHYRQCFGAAETHHAATGE